MTNGTRSSWGEWDQAPAVASGYATFEAARHERRRLAESNLAILGVLVEHAMANVTKAEAGKSIDLLKDLMGRLTKHGKQELQAFATQFGPLALRLAASMKVAQLMGDKARAADLELELDEVVSTARLKAARLGIVAQDGIEGAVEFAIQALVRSAIAFL